MPGYGVFPLVYKGFLHYTLPGDGLKQGYPIWGIPIPAPPLGAGFPLAYKGLLHYTLSRETPYWGIPGEGVMHHPSAAAT